MLTMEMSSPIVRVGGGATRSSAPLLPPSHVTTGASTMTPSDPASSDMAGAVISASIVITIGMGSTEPAIDCQLCDVSIVRAVHVTPSGDVAAAVDDCFTAQNTLPFHAIADQLPPPDGNVLDVQVMPSGDVAALVPDPTAQNVVPFQAMSYHVALAGNVREVHVTPSGDVAARVPAVPDIAQNTDPFHAIFRQNEDDGSVCAVQVMPSGDVAATVPVQDIAQNTVPFHAIPFHCDGAAGMVRAVQVTPSGDVAALVPLATAQNTVPFHAMAFHSSDEGRVWAVQVTPSGDVAALLLLPLETAQ